MLIVIKLMKYVYETASIVPSVESNTDCWNTGHP